MKHTTNSQLRLAAKAAGASLLLALLAGCATYDQQTQAFNQSSQSGSLMTAIPQIDQQVAKSAGSKDEIVFRLEQGATLRTAALADPTSVPSILPPPEKVKKGETPPPPPPAPTPEEVRAFYAKRSNEAFDRAEDRVNKYEEEAKVKVGAELGAALTNLASLPYRGRSYDKVMMNAYKALNYMTLGDKDKARVELNRSLQRQRDAVAANEKRIAAAQDEAEKAARGELKDESGKSAAYDSSRAQTDARTGPALQAALDASLAPMKPYGDYVNPFAVFLDGLFFTVLGENGDDLERGRKSFERVAAIVPENNYLREDLNAAASAAEGKAPEGVTYVIFETGQAPRREQVRIDIPTFLVSSRLPYVGAAFPKLVFNGNYHGGLSIVAGDQQLTTATVASMDSVVANDFKNEWPTIVTKTMITAATKAIISAAVQKQVEDQGGMFAGLAAGLIMGGINAATTVADTRTWSSLPKEFQYARLATPASRELTIAAGPQQQTVKLADGSVNVVYVKSASANSPLLVTQFALK
jgi:hypothetical protein